jgi:large-conductance mechanosensitive channel
MRTFLTITRLFITTLLCILIAFCILLIVVMYPNLTKEKEKEQSIYNKEVEFTEVKE